MACACTGMMLGWEQVLPHFRVPDAGVSGSYGCFRTVVIAVRQRPQVACDELGVEAGRTRNRRRAGWHRCLTGVILWN